MKLECELEIQDSGQLFIRLKDGRVELLSTWLRDASKEIKLLATNALEHEAKRLKAIQSRITGPGSA